ncbi:MAG: hypothetical protein DRI54_08585 [Bacteroidetes bacterium]|nr:MAG: hypothetical protein DRI54_08585 [Bacteroidota bacterium]
MPEYIPRIKGKSSLIKGISLKLNIEGKKLSLFIDVVNSLKHLIFDLVKKTMILLSGEHPILR